MRISEIRGEDAIDVLADIMMPASKIFSDKRIVELFRKKDIPKAINVILKKHPKNILEIMAILERENPETYNPSLLALPAKLLEIFNDPELIKLFYWQEQTEEQTYSGPAMENTEESEQ